MKFVILVLMLKLGVKEAKFIAKDLSSFLAV